MTVFLYLVSFIFIAVGAIAVLAAKSDIQVIVAVLSFGFAVLAIGLSGVISTIQKTIPEKTRVRPPELQ